MNNISIKPRLEYIDIMKGWAIMLIVLFHQHNPFSTTLTAWLMGRGCDVPIFFILAGFFLKDEKLIQPTTFILSKLKALYLPATIISIIFILLHNVLIDIGWYTLDSHYYYSTSFTIRKIIRSICGLDSGETILGAMWFLYTLLYDFIIMSVLAWGLKKILKKEGGWQKAMAIFLVICMAVSCYLTKQKGIFFSQINVVLSSMFLIWCGRLVFQNFHWSFENKWTLAIATLIFIDEVFFTHVHPRFALNEYQSVTQLLALCWSSIYIWGYIGKQISSSFVGKALSFMGRESLYVMAFHIIGLFCCNSLLEWLDIKHIGDTRGIYTYLIIDTWMTLLYLVVGCAVPLIIITIFNRCLLLFHYKKESNLLK